MARVDLVSPPPLFEALRLVEPLIGRKPWLRKAAVAQLVTGAATGLVVGGRLLVVIDFYPLGDGLEELTMWSAPAADCRPHLTALYRAGRLTIARRLHSGITGLVARVAPSAAGTPPGCRLCAALGFSEVPRMASDEPFVWTLAGWCDDADRSRAVRRR